MGSVFAVTERSTFFFILSSCSLPFWFGRVFAAEVPFRGPFLVFVDVASPRFYFFDAERVQVNVYCAYSVELLHVAVCPEDRD